MPISSISGQEVASNAASTTQVYQVTHDKDGNYLPYMNRAFISFSYGGKNIEDFNLLAIIENNEIQRNIYADFTDNVSTSTIYDGQIYWSTHYDTNSLELTLVTDGMTDKELDEFKQWFKPGRIEELILSEHPNRGILARINTPPVMRLLPFEKKVTFSIRDAEGQVVERNTSTTLYKGFISLSFIMDDPFWHSLKNILNLIKQQGSYIFVNTWEGPNGLEDILTSPDALKVIYEDNVPISYMIDLSTIPAMEFGDKIIVMAENEEEEEAAETILIEDSGIDIKAIGTPGDVQDHGYLYYAGNAPCYPELSFELQPEFDNNGYISIPFNSYNDNILNYNTITIESSTKTEFKFTTPSIFEGYNQALKILLSHTNETAEEMREKLRDEVKHYAPRQYAIAYLQDLDIDNNTYPNESAIITAMENFLNVPGANPAPAHCSFIFDGAKGTATASITYYPYVSSGTREATITEENVEDMVCSSYPLIVDRNYPANGKILPYVETNATTKAYSHIFYADCDLYNVRFKYQYLYL